MKLWRAIVGNLGRDIAWNVGLGLHHLTFQSIDLQMVEAPGGANQGKLALTTETSPNSP